MITKALLLTSALLLSLTSCDQSSCRVIWLFKLSCSEPADALVNQVKVWSTTKCREGKEKCMYELEESSPTIVKVKHTSPNTRKTNAITFEFNPLAAPRFCRVKGTSTSSSHNNTSPNDYCLFYNLMEGSGLTAATGYREISNDVMCPSLKTAQCKK